MGLFLIKKQKPEHFKAKIVTTRADVFLSSSPLMHFIMYGGVGRILMRSYRDFKRINRPKWARQDVWG